MTDPEIPDPVLVPIGHLKPHPRNYRHHPPDQVEHIAASIEENGFYRNIVAAQDQTILAGHGTVLGAGHLGMTEVPVVILDIEPDSPQALKILAADNELARFAEVDDRVLTDLLREVSESSPSQLRGTGYDDMMLANLLMVTRPTSEIRDLGAAAEWVGMPEFDPVNAPVRLVISFTSVEDRQRFVDEHDLGLIKGGTTQAWSTQWPFNGRQDLASVRFEK